MAAIRPACAGEPVTARINQGKAINETCDPMAETTCPLHSSRKSRLRHNEAELAGAMRVSGIAFPYLAHGKADYVVIYCARKQYTTILDEESLYDHHRTDAHRAGFDGRDAGTGGCLLRRKHTARRVEFSYQRFAFSAPVYPRAGTD